MMAPSNYDMQAFDSDGNVVGIGSTVTDHHGQKAELLKLSRWEMPGKSGKVYVRWLDSGTACEYYDGVFGLSVKLIKASDDPSFKLSELSKELLFKINAFKASVRTRSHHPSMVSRAALKRNLQNIQAVYAFLIRMNQYQELPDDEIRKEVIQCEIIIEAMYSKQ